MRQAGRYMSEYRALRARYSLLDLCRTPDLATEVTLQPVRRIEVDAAILFSDLLLPLEPMGIRFDFVQGEGPAIENPIRDEDDINHLRRFEPRESLSHVLDAIRQIQRELGGRVPLIGFAGAPFTLASYAIEGGHSSNFAKTKALMYGIPAAWHRLCAFLADIVSEYLAAQIEAGVDAVQVFDSWVGALNARDYREFILPHTRRIFESLARVRRADDSFRGRDRRHSRRAPRSGRPRHRRRLAHAARRRMGTHWLRSRHSGQSRSDVAARSARSRADGRRRCPRAGRRTGRAHLQSRARDPASTPVEHVQALARYVHQQTRTA